MSSWSAHFGGHRSISMDELKVFLFRFLFCLVIEYYWVNNLPGASFGFNRMFSYIAGAIAQALDQNSLNQLTQLLAIAGHNTPMPSVFAPMETFCYWFVEGFLGLASGVLFLINCSSFIFYAVAALFGPLFVPLYLTQTFRSKFLHFVEVLAGFAMIRAVAAAFIFVWSQFLVGFINQTFQGNYSIENWLANLIPFLTIFVAFILNMILIPSITQIIFGGGAGAAGTMTELLTRLSIFGI
jgi:type IV secretion system protein VirB6